MDRERILEKWGEIERLDVNPRLAVANQLLHKAWGGHRTPGTPWIYYNCAVDIMENQDAYTNISSCTPTLCQVSDIMSNRWDELDIIEGTAFFNEYFKYKSYKTTMKAEVEKLTEDEKSQRLLELDDPMFLINKLRDQT